MRRKQLSFRGCFHRIHTPQNCHNRGGDDRQVSQNGKPFCTGCTLSGRILNLQGSSTPFEPLAGSPKMEQQNIRRKFCCSIPGFAGECTYSISVCASRCIREAACKLCGLRRSQIAAGNVQADPEKLLYQEKIVKHMPDFLKNQSRDFLPFEILPLDNVLTAILHDIRQQAAGNYHFRSVVSESQ